MSHLVLDKVHFLLKSLVQDGVHCEARVFWVLHVLILHLGDVPRTHLQPAQSGVCHALCVYVVCVCVCVSVAVCEAECVCVWMCMLTV